MKILLVGIPAEPSELNETEKDFWREFYSNRVGTTLSKLKKEEISLLENIENQHLGLLHLAANLLKDGHDVQYLAPSPGTRGIFEKQLTDIVNKTKFGLVGFTVMNLTYKKAIGMAVIVKKQQPEATIVFGGPHATHCDNNILKEHAEVDIVVRGEGEETMQELVNKLETNGELESVRGLSFRKNGAIIRTHERDRSNKIGSPHHAYSLLGVDKLPASRIVTSRGCNGNCAFCADAIWRGKISYREKESFKKEIEYLYHNKGTRFFYFSNEDFLSSEEHARSVCEAFNELGLERKSWSCQTKASNVLRNQHLLPLLKEAGCAEVQIGFESASDSILQLNRKGMTAEVAVQALKKIKDAGLRAYAYWIVGLPGETKETISHTASTIETLIDNGVMDLCEINMFVPSHGSDVFKDPAKYGVTIQEGPSYRNRAFVSTAGMSAQEIYDSYLNTLKVSTAALARKREREGYEKLPVLPVDTGRFQALF